MMYAKMMDHSIILGLDGPEIKQLMQGQTLTIQAPDMGIQIMVIYGNDRKNLSDIMEAITDAPLPPPTQSH
jgi:nitrous oxidase accessory protein NosD